MAKRKKFPEPSPEDMAWAEGVGRKYYSRLPKHVSVDDIVQEARLGLCDAMRRYKPSKGNFRTYAYKRIFGHIIDWQRTSENSRLNKRYNLVFVPFSALTSASYRNSFDLDAHEAFVYVKDNPLEVLAHRDEFQRIVMKLNACSKKVIELRYRDDLTHREIALKMGLSESRISQVHAEAIEVLKGNRRPKIQKGRWPENYQRAKDYLLKHREIPSDRGPHKLIAQWLRTQRARARRQLLHPAQLELLMDLPLWYH